MMGLKTIEQFAMKRILLIILMSPTICAVSAQKYITEKSKVIFFSDAPIEDIVAENKNVSGIVDLSTLQMVFSIPIMDFQFEKKLMKEHFNEKYMETEKFPKAIFQGHIINVVIKESGEQKVIAKGKLSIHGITKEVEIPGTFNISQENKILIKSTFLIKLSDYSINIPQLLWQNIAEQVEVKLDFQLKPKS